jgi:hypothetical protein
MGKMRLPFIDSDLLYRGASSWKYSGPLGDYQGLNELKYTIYHFQRENLPYIAIDVFVVY